MSDQLALIPIRNSAGKLIFISSTILSLEYSPNTEDFILALPGPDLIHIPEEEAVCLLITLNDWARSTASDYIKVAIRSAQK